MLQTAAVNRGGTRQTAAVDELDAVFIHDRRGGRAVNALQTARVHQRCESQTAGFHMLNSALTDNGTTRRTGDRLNAAEQHGI